MLCVVRPSGLLLLFLLLLLLFLLPADDVGGIQL